MATIAICPLAQLPDASPTTSAVVGNLEMAGLDFLGGVAPCYVNIHAPNGAYPYNPACPNFQGLPWNAGGVTVNIGKQHSQSSALALLLVIVILWGFLH